MIGEQPSTTNQRASLPVVSGEIGDQVVADMREYGAAAVFQAAETAVGRDNERLMSVVGRILAHYGITSEEQLKNCPHEHSHYL